MAASRGRRRRPAATTGRWSCRIGRRWQPDCVVHVGEPIALVVAETLAAARAAADLVAVDYDERPAVTGATTALAPGAPQIWPEAPGNLALDWVHPAISDRRAGGGATHHRVGAACRPRARRQPAPRRGADRDARCDRHLRCRGRALHAARAIAERAFAQGRPLRHHGTRPGGTPCSVGRCRRRLRPEDAALPRTRGIAGRGED